MENYSLNRGWNESVIEYAERLVAQGKAQKGILHLSRLLAHFANMASEKSEDMYSKESWNFEKARKGERDSRTTNVVLKRGRKAQRAKDGAYILRHRDVTYGDCDVWYDDLYWYDDWYYFEGE